MRSVMPRNLRPRFLLPLILGVMIVPALLTGSANPAESGIHAGTICSNVAAPAKTVVKPRPPPNCVNCRAPLLNAPLARAERDAPATSLVALPPAV
jgi:hypothetical protein